jgi:hypothetical protein
VRASSVSPTVVVGGQHPYLNVAEREEVTWLHLAEPHPAGGDWLEQPARACWGYQNPGGWNQLERRNVGVVGVEM